MKTSLLESMMASSPVRTHLGTRALSQSPKKYGVTTYPSMKVSLVLENLPLNDVGKPRTNYSRLLVVGILYRVRWAINHQLSLFPWPAIRPIGLE